MKHWRDQFFLSSIAGNGTGYYCAEGHGKAKFYANDLLAHCRHKANDDCAIHYGIKNYLITLHSIYISSEGVKTNFFEVTKKLDVQKIKKNQTKKIQSNIDSIGIQNITTESIHVGDIKISGNKEKERKINIDKLTHAKKYIYI